MDEQTRCEKLLRRAWDLHLKISEMQAFRKAQQEDGAGAASTELEKGLDALLLAMEQQVEAWVRQIWVMLRELEGQQTR
jgi:hypothetical protein